MGSQVKPIPDEYRCATPYIICRGAAAAIEFYKNAFGATELFRMGGPDGKIGHAEIRIGKDAIIMLADEFPERDARSPRTIGGSPVSLFIYVEDVDSFARRAEAAGAIVKRPIANQPYGDRMVLYEDPFGHKWAFATHIEDVTPEDVKKRMASQACGS